MDRRGRDVSPKHLVFCILYAWRLTAPMSNRNFFAELKRRNVYKVAVAYAVVSWLLIQVATQVFPFFEIPNWAVQMVVVALVIGFPIALVLSWAFELTSEGIKRENEVDRKVARKTGRKLTAVVVVVAAAATGLMLFRLLHSQQAIEQGKQAPPAPEIDRKSIAVQLRVHLTGREEQVIAAKPTDNPEAYDAYLRGLAYTLKTQNTPANYLGAQKYLREAVRLDPKFALAWALLAYVDARGYHTTNIQPTVALRDEARQAMETALGLDPSLGEAWIAKGYYQYGCVGDFEGARRSYEQARELLPNSSLVRLSLALLARDQGQWERAESYFEEAERLDPRNLNLLTRHAQFYITLRDFPEALRKLDQILEIVPDDTDALVEKGAIAQAQGDLPRAASILTPLRPAAGDPTGWEQVSYQAILERRPAEIILRLKELLTSPDPNIGYLNGELRFWLGWAQEVADDNEAARETWRQARAELEALVKDQPENWALLDDLALATASLGDKAAALALVDRAIALNPIAKDAANGK